MPFGLSTDKNNGLKLQYRLFRSSDFRETKFLRISPEHILDFIANSPEVIRDFGAASFNIFFFRRGCLLLQGVFSVMLNGCLIYQCFTPQVQNSLVLNSLQKNRIIFQKNCASLFDEWQMCLQLPTVDVPQLSHLPSLSSST